MKSWTESIIQKWRLENIKLNKGALIEMIVETENALGFRFPGEFMELYLQVDGFADMEVPGNRYSIWPIQKILEEYRENKNKHFIGFSHSLINGHIIGFLKNSIGIFKITDQQHPIAMSFKESILLINKDPSVPI
jgi:cell wall assembly regulator SMI1